MERIKLNLIPSGVAPIVHLSQYDDGRKFGIDLFEGESVYVLDGTETLTVNSRKPDGHVVTLTVTNTGTSFLDVDTVEQLTAVHGVSYAKLKIEKGSVTIATLSFLIDVSRDPLENGDPSESFVQNLQSQIAEAVSEQYDADSVIFDPTPTQGHGTGFAVTSEGVANALDNLPIPDELNDLSDVDISDQAQGEALVWDGTKWVNGTVSTVGSIDDLDDVDTSGKASGDSLRYNGNEWVAKPTTIALTQAEYDALQTKEPNTHYVITDAPNLNPTASDIEYSSGVTVKQAIDSKQDKYWKKLSSAFELTGNATGTWSFTDDLSTSKYTDIMFCISLVSDDSGVRSSMSLSRLGFEAYGVFYDYTIGSDRMYFQLSKTSNNSFTVSGTNLGGISSRVFVTAYYR